MFVKLFACGEVGNYRNCKMLQHEYFEVASHHAPENIKIERNYKI